MEPADLIDALGGSAAVAEKLDVVPSAVGNWRKRGFPAWALLALGRLCQERGIEAGPALDPQHPRRSAAAE